MINQSVIKNVERFPSFKIDLIYNDWLGYTADVTTCNARNKSDFMLNEFFNYSTSKEYILDMRSQKFSILAVI